MNGLARERHRPQLHRALSIVLGTSIITLILFGPTSVQAKPILTVRPPLAVSIAGTSNSALMNTGCKNESLLIGPSVNLTSGEIRIKTFDSASRSVLGHPGCRAAVSTEEWIYGPAFRAGSSGSYQVVYSWNVSWNMSSTCNGSSATCSNSSFAAIKLFGNLYDNTTGSWVLSTNLEKSVFHLRGPGSGAGGNWAFRLRISPTLVLGDYYVLYTGLSTISWTKSGCVSAGCFNSSATIDVGDNSMPLVHNGAWLVSMIVN
jgi:hypothetical protein